MSEEAQVEKKLDLDWDSVKEELSAHVRQYFETTHARGAAIGLSGGLDSSVAAATLVNALGRRRVLGLILNSAKTTPLQDLRNARDFGTNLGIKLLEIETDPIYASFTRANPLSSAVNRIPNGNLRARIRMALLYYAANSQGLLVAGTSDRSEISIGYFTKYGDGGVDFLPIGDLYKTQVRMFARQMGLPKKISEKASSPTLWPGHTAEKELGLTYHTIDMILYALQDERLQPTEITRKYGIEHWKVQRVSHMQRISQHKRRLPPVLRIHSVQAKFASHLSSPISKKKTRLHTPL